MRGCSYVPYSGFQVGLLTREGKNLYRMQD